MKKTNQQLKELRDEYLKSEFKNYRRFLEQKLIQPEPPSVVQEEDIWNKEQMEKVKDYILTESSKQTEEQKKHIIDFANRLSETKNSIEKK